MILLPSLESTAVLNDHEEETGEFLQPTGTVKPNVVTFQEENV